MIKRTLFVINWQQFTERHRLWITEQAGKCDELIFLIEDTQLLPDGITPGALLARIHSFLSSFIAIPFYLLPVPAKGVTPPYNWLRWRILCPPFQKVFTDNAVHQRAMEQALRVPVTVLPPLAGVGVEIEPAGLEKSRGLFITRAQPFHNGHLAFIEQMKAEVDELIIVIAMANRSHQLADIATAGERLAMVLPVLEQTVPGRYYLAALPYSDFTMENIYELEWLLPAFTRVYTTNPSVAVMAATAGYETVALQQRLTVSSTLVRDGMVKGLPVDAYVPATVLAFIQQHGIDRRLQQLHEKENRG